MYPVSDTVFVHAFKNGDTYNFIEYKWFFSNSGKAIRVKGELWDGSKYYLLPLWIEDSFILDAKDLLAAGRTTEALAKFREAYAQNPEHYYLANYIRHLECILNPDYETLKSVFKSYVGYFGDLRFHTEDDRLFWTDYEGLIFELLPLSEDMFMVPSKYELQVQIVKENGLESGLKYIHRDGREEYFQRMNTETWPD